MPPRCSKLYVPYFKIPATHKILYHCEVPLDVCKCCCEHMANMDEHYSTGTPQSDFEVNAARQMNKDNFILPVVCQWGNYKELHLTQGEASPHSALASCSCLARQPRYSSRWIRRRGPTKLHLQRSSVRSD